MPPRKKARGSAPAVAEEDPMDIDPQTPAAAAPTTKKPTSPLPYNMLKDPWTDEQEISLFKGIMKWKPNGMHKHFRMIALSEYLRNHGYDPRLEPHTNVDGIWKKLGTMYNMSIIDERENSFEYDEDLKDKYEEFTLPEEWAHEMFVRGKRRASEPGSEDEEEVGSTQGEAVGRKRKRGDTVTRRRASTVEDTDEAGTQEEEVVEELESLPVKPRRTRGRAATESERSRQHSKDTTVEEEAEEGDEDDEDVEEEEGSPSPKQTKGKGRAKVEQPTARKSKRKK
ncbi:chromatin modification-related protein EAF7-domain-containing protein [Bisporella sp. PMI_857]|nr:chromatin modification-related protein EAF7-domain-containing protein [Bisporella sp. PMI_857]